MSWKTLNQVTIFSSPQIAPLLKGQVLLNVCWIVEQDFLKEMKPVYSAGVLAPLPLYLIEINWME